MNESYFDSASPFFLFFAAAPFFSREFDAFKTASLSGKLFF